MDFHGMLQSVSRTDSMLLLGKMLTLGSRLKIKGSHFESSWRAFA